MTDEQVHDLRRSFSNRESHEASPDAGLRVRAGGEASETDRPADWFWEGNVQDAVVAWLIGQGWHIDQLANTARRDRGHDIEASKGTHRLIVEVKGYPSTAYRDPRRADEVKRTQPSLQAKHWLADALLKSIRIRALSPQAEVAIALPNFPRYRKLLTEINEALAKLDIAVLIVDSDHRIEGHGLRSTSRAST